MCTALLNFHNVTLWSCPSNIQCETFHSTSELNDSQFTSNVSLTSTFSSPASMPSPSPFSSPASMPSPSVGLSTHLTENVERGIHANVSNGTFLNISVGSNSTVSVCGDDCNFNAVHLAWIIPLCLMCLIMIYKCVIRGKRVQSMWLPTINLIQRSMSWPGNPGRSGDPVLSDLRRIQSEPTIDIIL